MANSADVENNRLALKKPDLADLVKNLSLALEEPGRPASMFWFEAVTKNEFKLSVVVNPDGGDPLWQLEKTSDWFEKKTVFVKRTFDADKILVALSASNQLASILEERLGISSNKSEPGSPVEDAQAAQITQSVEKIQIAQSISGSYSPIPGGFITGFSEEFSTREKAEPSRPVKSVATISANNLMRRIGVEVELEQLMLAAGLLTTAQVAEASSKSEQTGLHVGRVLTDSGAIPEKLMRDALRLQSLLRNGELDLKLAAAALALINEANIEPEAALRILGWNRAYFEKYQQLAAIIFDAQLANFGDLQASLEICFSQKLPLALVLLQRRICSEVAMYASVAAQSLVIEGHLTRAEAVRIIKSVSAVSESLGVWLKTEHIIVTVNERLKLGEMLVNARILTGADLLDVLERSLIEEKLLEQILVSRQLLTAELADTLVTILNHAATPQEAAQRARTAYIKAGNTLATSKSGDASELAFDLIRAAGLSSADDLAGIMEELALRKQHLAYKVVYQYEQVKATVARDLHDVVLADLLNIKRSVSSAEVFSRDEMVQALDGVVLSLREIVNDYAPRQLHDWGLSTFLDDLVERFSKRTSIACQYHIDGEVPDLPEQVELQIFRIIQEAFNNIEKYSHARTVTLFLSSDASLLSIEIVDDGKGFEDKGEPEDEITSGGTGLLGMDERVQLIRCYLPAQFSIESSPGKGVRILLEIEVGKANGEA